MNLYVDVRFEPDHHCRDASVCVDLPHDDPQVSLVEYSLTAEGALGQATGVRHGVPVASEVRVLPVGVTLSKAVPTTTRELS